MHSSITLNEPIELIDVTPLNPLISKCKIKVCYVGDEPNRNRSIITKDVARKMANSIPGSPIVGFFNEEAQDFEEHNRELEIKDGKLNFKDTTKPYGFVDLNAKCWFEKYKDDGENDREYLVTEGYLWTGQYPEAQRIIDKGNNQSMELDSNIIDAYWTKDSNNKPEFFIINEAIISKLCILGEEFEPCFEGSSITKVQFSFEDSFQTKLFSMMDEIKELINKGGAQMFTTFAVKVGDPTWTALYAHVKGLNEAYRIEGTFEDNGQKFAVIKDADEKYSRLDFSIAEDESLEFSAELSDIEYTPADEAQFSLEEVEAFEAEYKKAEDDKKKKEEDDAAAKEDPAKEGGSEDGASKEGAKAPAKEDNAAKDDKSGASDSEDDEKKKKEKDKKKFSLEEEYKNLAVSFAKLEQELKTAKEQIVALTSENDGLKEFKLQTQRAEKEAMIKERFFMLSDDDKKDVMDNIDTYSLDDIEKELSVIYVRNKVDFSLGNDKGSEDENDPTTFNLGGKEAEMDSDTPAWVKAVLEVEKHL